MYNCTACDEIKANYNRVPREQDMQYKVVDCSASENNFLLCQYFGTRKLPQLVNVA
jgi:hypothetical protein